MHKMFLKKKTKALLTNEELMKVQNQKIKELSYGKWLENGYEIGDDCSTKLVSEYTEKDYDEWINELVKRNGTTKY